MRSVPARWLAAGLAITAASAATAASKAGPGDAWWAIVEALAADRFAGRLTGTPGYDAAAAQVVAEFRRIGLRPAGTQGYYQPVDFIEQRIAAATSSASLTGTGADLPLAVPQDIYFRGSHAMPATVDAPLVFAGYGLSLPDLGHDDFAGLDLRGRLVVVIAGGPPGLPGSAKASARSERAALLTERGAAGIVSLTTARQIEIPWARQVSLSARPSMYLADAALREVPVPFVAATFSPDRAAQLFAGEDHAFADLAAAADAGAPLPRFALRKRLAARIAATARPVRSANLVALLPGRDARLAREHIVLSAHLDGLGVGEPVGGDAIYNGALDNAGGVANVIEIARDLAKGRRPRRSILFLVPTAEEQGLLGSRYFVKRPTVPLSGIVANINFDMPLPIFALRTITPIGYEESTLGDDAAAVSAQAGLPIVPDPFPDRNVFIRSDQYSFVRAGIPALFPKFGFAAGTPEATVERAWRANVYHSPSDDAKQPVLRGEMAVMNRWTTALLRRIADAPGHPAWRPGSRFARTPD